MKLDILKIGMAQIAPVWLDRHQTLSKIEHFIAEAGEAGTDLLVFGEGVLPGYPFWLAYTEGAAWETKVNKELYAYYLSNAINPYKDLTTLSTLAEKFEMAIYLGTIERAEDRGGHSVYCSLVFLDKKGKIQSVHRKLQPTYDERLVWAIGDGHGLKTHKIKSFKVGGLNCWENWMPLPRAALYGQGENVHVAVWPGNEVNTKDITRFIARESRSYAISVSSLLKAADIPEVVPHRDLIVSAAPEILANGGSCIAGPDGEWLVAPVLNEEGIIYADLHLQRIYEERQNFDVSGHYSRPDVTRLVVNRKRQHTTDFTD